MNLDKPLNIPNSWTRVWDKEREYKFWNPRHQEIDDLDIYTYDHQPSLHCEELGQTAWRIQPIEIKNREYDLILSWGKATQGVSDSGGDPRPNCKGDFILCSSHKNKQVAICIFQATENHDEAFDIAQTFQWTDIPEEVMSQAQAELKQKVQEVITSPNFDGWGWPGFRSELE